MFNDLTQNDILNSIEDIKKKPYLKNETSTDYSVWFHYKLFSPKPIIRRAYKLKNKSIHNFNTDQAQDRLLELGFPIVNKLYGKTNSRFSKKELLSFVQIIDRPKYNPKNDTDKNIRLFLRDMTWNKTKIWAELLRDKGWEISGRRAWNVQSRNYGQSYKPYTWWKIFPKGHKSDLIYFTVGVHWDGTLVYKIDIQREDKFFKRCPERKNHFDKRAKAIKANWKHIEVEEVESYTLEALADIMDKFLLLHQDSYHKIVHEVMNIHPIVATRICWNESDWREPSGINGKSTSNSFESKHGFGHDEWLLDLDCQKDGYCYARLQNIANYAKDRMDKMLDMVLFTYDRSISKNQWIGKISNVEVISKKLSEEVANSQEGISWFQERSEQLKKRADVNQIEYVNTAKDDLYNIRFKPSNVETFSPFIPDVISLAPTINRYVVIPFSEEFVEQILSLTNEDKESNKSERNNNSNTLPNFKGKIKKKSSPFEREYDNIHGLIQEEVIIWLRNRGYTVRYEQRIIKGNRSVDIVLDLPDEKKSFIEVKSYSSIDTSVRVAMGQLLEYNFFIDCERAKQLIIISHHKIKPSIEKYLKNLRQRLKVEIYYLQYDMEKRELVDSEGLF